MKGLSKRIIALAGLLLLLVLVGWGCGSPDDEPAFSPAPESFTEAQVMIAGVGEERTIARVDSTFFGMHAPLLGRDFVPQDYEGRTPVALLSHPFWEERFEARPEIIGTHLVVGGVERTIVGVMPAGVDVPAGVALWIPGDGDGPPGESGPGAAAEPVVVGETAVLHLADGSTVRGLGVMIRAADGSTTPAVFLGPRALAEMFTDGTFEFSADGLPSRVRLPREGERLVGAAR